MPDKRVGRTPAVRGLAGSEDSSTRALLDQMLRPGGEIYNIGTTSVNYTLRLEDHTLLVDATGGVRTITLPPALEAKHQIYMIKKVDVSGNAVTVDGDGSETIDGVTTKPLAAQYNYIVVQSDGTSWHIVG